MTILETIIQGIIQGLTEFLPVSSSGHLSVYQYLTGNSGESGFLLALVLHFGTLLAVFIAFRKLIWALLKEFISLIKDIFTLKFKFNAMNGERRMLIMLVVSCAVLIPFYFLIGDFAEKISQDDSILAEGFCFLYTSVILLLACVWGKGKKQKENITFGNALTVGIFQYIALLPGVSRSGSTICGGLFSGFSRELAVSYSFILGIPTILAGCIVEIKNISDTGTAALELTPMLIGFVVSASVGLCAIKLINLVVKTNKLYIFSIYTFILGVFVVGYSIIK